MREIVLKPTFEKSVKTLQKKHYPMDKLNNALIAMRESDGILNGRFHDHALSGNLSGYRELHIEQNMLMLYKITDSEIILVRIGTHDELFK